MSSYLFGTKIPLVETLGRNTLKYREDRETFVKGCSDSAVKAVISELVGISTKSITPEAKFDFKDVAFQNKAQIVGSSDDERSRIIDNVASKIKEEKLETLVEGSVLTIKWTVPVAAPPVVQTPAPAPDAAAPAVAADDKNKK